MSNLLNKSLSKIKLIIGLRLEDGGNNLWKNKNS